MMALVIGMVTLFAGPESTYADVQVNAESAILVDADTGEVLFSKEADLTLPPASMTKIMTEYLVFEAIENGEISWDTTTQIGDYPYSISADAAFSGVGLKQNKDYTVRELYEAMAINSDNATTIALAQLIAGSESDFVKRMNEKAEEMGLPDYQFVNATGLNNSDLGGNHPEGTEPDANNLMSARSAALLAYHLINDYPEALDISNVKETTFDGQTIQNWNWMLPDMPGHLAQFGYEGVDGMKTGFTDLAGFCFTGTAKQGDQRLISVVMKTDSKEARFQETQKLFDFGFNNFESKELFPAGHQLEGESELGVVKGKEDNVEIESAEAIQTMVQNGEEDKYSMEYKLDEDALNKDGELVAPVEEGQKVGTAQLVYSGEQSHGNILNDTSGQQSVELVASSAVEKSNWFMLMIGSVGDFFSDVFSSAADTVKGWF
ncbi:serine hydrolase [Thalassobacillus sp. CUG 92003]|uniref:serine hydrolase n=1 Tax=Thalassobacillus sp. CUG 92003 TaxID=2736641 RepID=UPI0015E6FE50